MTNETPTCPYCEIDEMDAMEHNEFGMIVPALTPLSQGHSVIIPRRHVASFFEVTDKERKSLVTLLELARNELKIRHHPAGFHIGFTDGEIFNCPAQHLHIHVIPRYQGQPLKLDETWGIES